MLEIVENTVHIRAVSVDGEFSEAAKTLHTQFFRLLDTLFRKEDKTAQRQDAIGESYGAIENIGVVTLKEAGRSPGEAEYHRAVYPVFIHRLDKGFRRSHFRVGTTVQKCEFRLVCKEPVPPAGDIGGENVRVNVYNQG